MQQTYNFKAKVWLYSGKAAWHFITLPLEIAEEISDIFHLAKRGWGSLPVEITVGTTKWTTSIFPDKETGSYLLPLKAEIRKKEGINEGDELNLTLKVKD